MTNREVIIMQIAAKKLNDEHMERERKRSR